MTPNSFRLLICCFLWISSAKAQDSLVTINESSVEITKIGPHYFIYHGDSVNQHGFWTWREDRGPKTYFMALFFRGYPVYYRDVINGKEVEYHRYIKVIKYFNLLY